MPEQCNCIVTLEHHAARTLQVGLGHVFIQVIPVCHCPRDKLEHRLGPLAPHSVHLRHHGHKVEAVLVALGGVSLVLHLALILRRSHASRHTRTFDELGLQSVGDREVEASMG